MGLASNDQPVAEVLAPAHVDDVSERLPARAGLLGHGRATSAKRLETFDVVADVASARARRFRGGVRGARAPLQVCKPHFGGYAWGGRASGGLYTFSATSTASSSAFVVLNAFGANPRGARRAIDSEGDGRRDPTPKTARERARSPRRRARDVKQDDSESIKAKRTGTSC